jgi:hypothetical protein
VLRRAVVALSCLAACSCEDVWITYDPCSPLSIAVLPGTEPVESKSVEDAIEAWSRVVPMQVEIRVGERDPGSLPIVFESDTYYRASYFQNRGEISVDRHHLAPDDYAIAIAHELGHAFGLDHVAAEDRRSVMNVGNLTVPPTEDDAAALREQWKSCR